MTGSPPPVKSETEEGFPLSVGVSAGTQELMVENTFRDMMANKTPLKTYLEQCEKAYLEYVFQYESSTYKVAELLDTSQSSIMRKKQKYRL